MPSRAATQRIVTLATKVLDSAAYASTTQTIDRPEVRLALAVLWSILGEKRWLKDYWSKANHVSGHPWESCREAYYGIMHDLREEGWEAPV